MINIQNLQQYGYMIQYSNVSNWASFITGYQPITTGNSIQLGQLDWSTYASQPSIVISPITNVSQLYQLINLQFGYTQETCSSYMSIYSDSTMVLTMDFRGLGLPTTTYDKFTNLLAIATAGQVSCAKTQGGLCVLPKTCDKYKDLFTYSFQL